MYTVVMAAGLAQRLERCPEEAGVPSSTLGPGTITKNTNPAGFVFLVINNFMHKNRTRWYNKARYKARGSNSYPQMRKDKESAIKLRRSGRSYKQIRAELGIPIATLSDWFRNEPWSYDIKRRLASGASLANPEKLKLMVKATKEKWQKIHNSWQQEAVKEFPKLRNNYLFIAGLMLYWGEGDKKLENCQVALSNSDPHLIRLFYLFLTKVLNTPAEKISLGLLLYPDLVDQVQKNLWSKATNISLGRFKKSVVIQGRHPTKRNSYGVCIIRVNSRQLKEKIIKWLELSRQHLYARYDSGLD